MMNGTNYSIGIPESLLGMQLVGYLMGTGPTILCGYLMGV